MDRHISSTSLFHSRTDPTWKSHWESIFDLNRKQEKQKSTIDAINFITRFFFIQYSQKKFILIFKVLSQEFASISKVHFHSITQLILIFVPFYFALNFHTFAKSFQIIFSWRFILSKHCEAKHQRRGKKMKKWDEIVVLRFTS